MGQQGNNHISHYLCSRWFLCRHVWCRWGHCERTSYVSNGSSSQSIVCFISMYDTIHKFHCHNLFHSLWFIGQGLCISRPVYWVYSNLCWPNCSLLLYEQISKKLLHCIFNWWSSTFISISHDNSIDG